MRSGYESLVKLWQDDEEVTRGRWIRMAPTTPLIDTEHVFGSLKTWDRDADNSGPEPGEKLYVEWTNGANPLGYSGDHYCGPKIAYQEGGKKTRDLILTLLPSGMSTCCTGQPTVDQCGVSIPQNLHVRWDTHGGCACGEGWVQPIVWSPESLVQFGTQCHGYWGSPGPHPNTWGSTWPPPTTLQQLGICGAFGDVAVRPLYWWVSFFKEPNTCRYHGGVYLYCQDSVDTARLRFLYAGERVIFPVGGPIFPVTTQKFQFLNVGNCVVSGDDQWITLTFAP